jgi:hypothetical protein
VTKAIKPKFTHRLEALLVRAGLGILKTLPPVQASNLAGGVARSIGPLIPVSKVADRNLIAAMPELDAPARRSGKISAARSPNSPISESCGKPRPAPDFVSQAGSMWQLLCKAVAGF